MRSLVLSVLLLFTLTMIIYSCQDAGKVKQNMYHANGRDLYIKHCQNCHGEKGEGLSALAPPLTDSLFLKKNRHRLACFIKNGMNDTIIVHNRKYDGKMPDFATLANIDIAQVVVFITNSFGNAQGMYTPEEIAADLKNCK